MRALNIAVLVLLIIGGLNWGLIALFNFDLVAAIFGGDVGAKSGLSRLVYGIVGLAALYGLTFLANAGDGGISLRDRPRV